MDEFLKLPEVECGKLELIDGEIFPLEYAGFVHARVKSNLNEILVVWLSQQRIGRVFIETTYQLDDSEAVAPDLSVLRNERLAPATKDLPQGAPDLAIEVVSSELAERSRLKSGCISSTAAKFGLCIPTSVLSKFTTQRVMP